jgi:hypothetical protein
MSETKFTPGKYMRDEHTVYALNDEGVNRFSANIMRGRDDSGEKTTVAECEAVAQLFAASPDLYKALETVLSQYRLFVGPCDVIARGVVAQAESVLASARGELSPIHRTTKLKEREG